MIPPEKPTVVGATFPYIGLAVGVLALYAILAVTIPPNPYRSAVALAAFFAMGYCTLALIAGGRIAMSPAEILAFTVGLTIIVTSVSALAVSLAGIPITEFAVVIIGLPIGVISFLLRKPATHPVVAFVGFTRKLFDFSDYSTGEKGIAVALFVGILAALAIFISLANVHYPDQPSIALTLAGPNGTPDTLPNETSWIRGQPQAITVSAYGNDTAGSYVIRIRLIPRNATGSEVFHPASGTAPLRMDAFAEYREPMALAVQGNWTKSFSIAIDTAGTFTLRFEVLDSSDSVVAPAFVPVTVP